MHDGKVVHCEQDPQWQGIVGRSLEGTEHSVVASADTGKRALGVIDAIYSGDLDANLIVMSKMGSLENPAAIVERIKQLGLPVRTILLSNLTPEDFGVEVDAYVWKHDLNPGDLAKVIDELPEPEVTEGT